MSLNIERQFDKMIKFKASHNLNVKILDTSPPSTAEKDRELLTQLVYCAVELGVEREKKRNKTLKRN